MTVYIYIYIYTAKWLVLCSFDNSINFIDSKLYVKGKYKQYRTVSEVEYILQTVFNL